MILQELIYTEHAGKPNEWRLEPVRLGPLNLLVGKNASGKSRTISVINSLAALLSGDSKLKFSSGNYNVTFVDGKTVYKYVLVFEENKILQEEFSKNGLPLLKRNPGGIGEIFAVKSDQFMEFQTPDSELACVNRRDSIQHPYFEILNEWAKGVRLFRFGSSLGKESFAVLSSEHKAQFDPRKTDQVISVLKQGEADFGRGFIHGVINDMGVIGYELEDVGIRPPTGVVVEAPTPVELLGLFVKEKDLDDVTEQINMSQGMFRALSIVIQLNFSERSHHPSCILIDDIGEGLDFDRSCSIIELIMAKAKKGNFQLLMSTNDRFVMNKVPLQYWALIQRRGNVCHVFNEENSRERFEEFKFTGLNNFDFFATNFIDPNSDEENGNLR